MSGPFFRSTTARRSLHLRGPPGRPAGDAFDSTSLSAAVKAATYQRGPIGTAVDYAGGIIVSDGETLHPFETPSDADWPEEPVAALMRWRVVVDVVEHAESPSRHHDPP